MFIYGVRIDSYVSWFLINNEQFMSTIVHICIPFITLSLKAFHGSIFDHQSPTIISLNISNYKHSLTSNIGSQVVLDFKTSVFYLNLTRMVI